MRVAHGCRMDNGNVLDEDNGRVFTREEGSNVVIQDDKIR